jgi:hypothetical protein
MTNSLIWSWSINVPSCQMPCKQIWMKEQTKEGTGATFELQIYISADRWTGN